MLFIINNSRAKRDNTHASSMYLSRKKYATWWVVFFPDQFPRSATHTFAFRLLSSSFFCRSGAELLLKFPHHRWNFNNDCQSSRRWYINSVTMEKLRVLDCSNPRAFAFRKITSPLLSENEASCCNVVFRDVLLGAFARVRDTNDRRIDTNINWRRI